MKLKPSNMKTIEQEKSDYLTRLMAKYAAEEPNLTELAMESFSLGVTFAQQWISVEDELPEAVEHGESARVLIKTNKDEIFIASCHHSIDKTNHDWSVECNHLVDVEFWRPIEIK